MTGKRRRWRTRGTGNGVRPRRHRSPANRVRHDDLRWSARVADRVTAVFGSCAFNLLFSTQAACAAPLILLSQNRTAERDRVKAEHDFDVNVLVLRALAELLGDVQDQRAQHDLGAPDQRAAWRGSWRRAVGDRRPCRGSV
jgi:uncharacterized membrane protein